ncbi:MAG TPA: hypothetical protein DCQ98_09290 [Planctomycetaceae bacterium]|nr:hypothetical protein [Planctomycetaceae bacterium]
MSSRKSSNANCWSSTGRSRFGSWRSNCSRNDTCRILRRRRCCRPNARDSTNSSSGERSSSNAGSIERSSLRATAC